jgi:lysophospholipase L1-like esterase
MDAPRPVSKIRTVLAHVLLVLMGVAGTLLMAEGLAGLFWKAPWYERLLMEQQQSQQRPYRRNSLGLRGPEPTPAAPGGPRRVLLIGDSFTFGLGVEDDDAPFPAVLGRRLAGSDPPVEVVNGGIPGSVSADWLALWRRAGDLIDPDVVIVVFFLRDGTTLLTIPDFFGQIRREIARRNAGSTLYQYSHLYRRLRDLRDRSRVAEIYTESLIDAYVGEDTTEWQHAQQNLLELRSMVEDHGAVFGLAVFPVLVELDDDYPFQPVVDALMDFARRNDIQALDMLPAFRGLDGPDLWVSSLDQHPNAEGHELAAEALLPFVRELLAQSAPHGDREQAGVSPPRS